MINYTYFILYTRWWGANSSTRVFFSIVTPRIFNLKEVYINIYIIINWLVKREAVKLQFFKISCLLRRKQAYQHLTSPTWPTTTPHVCQEKSRRAKRRRNWDRIPFFCEYYIVKMVDTEVVKSVIEAFDPEETKHDTTNDICLIESWTSKGGVEEFCRIQWVSLIYFLTLLSKKGNISETMPKNWGNIKTAKERADQAWNKSGAAREHDIHRLERRKMDN